MEKRIDQMTDEELAKAEDEALNQIRAGQHQIHAGLNRIYDIHHERFAREVKKPRRRRKQS